MLKPVRELGLNWDQRPTELSSQLRYFIKYNIDFDVYLPSKGYNLQRDFCWTLNQKRELIYSILIGRHIPHLSVLNCVNYKNEKDGDIYQIIDGKQRLSAMIGFLQNLFTIVLEGNEYFYSDLPRDYQQAISCYHFRYYIVNEPYNNPITDDEKIKWFSYINFAGTPQDEEHLKKIQNNI